MGAARRTGGGAGLWVGVGCWCAQMQAPVDRQEAVHGYADGLSRTVRGRVITVRSLRDAKPIPGAPLSPVEPWQIERGGAEAEDGEMIQSVDLDLSAVEDVTPDLSTMTPVKGGCA